MFDQEGGGLRHVDVVFGGGVEPADEALLFAEGVQEGGVAKVTVLRLVALVT